MLEDSKESLYIQARYIENITGKGVVSNIWPKKFMPRYKTRTGEYIYADVIFNSSTMVNRENPGQTIEQSVTHVGSSIIDRIKAARIPINEAYDMIFRYINILSPKQAAYMDEMKKSMRAEELAFFIESIIEAGAIHLSIKPISEAVDIDMIARLYEEFPWVEQDEVEITLSDSEGIPRYIPARRKMIISKQYIFRLKQFAEEKYSSTSLSATNIRNENTKSKAKKDSRVIYSNTPIRFGSMETNNFNHLGAEIVIANMMIHSVSPQGRRLVEQMYTTDNPFVIDIKLDSNSSNRSAEIANTFLKTIGRRLKFIKKKKGGSPITFSPISFHSDPTPSPISFIPKQDWGKIDYEKDFKEKMRRKKLIDEGKVTSPISFNGNFKG